MTFVSAKNQKHDQQVLKVKQENAKKPSKTVKKVSIQEAKPQAKEVLKEVENLIWFPTQKQMTHLSI